MNQIFPKHAVFAGCLLINHKNFYFTQIPDKTNDVIFLNSPETMFSGHFCPMGIFSKKFWLGRTQLYMGPYHHAKFQQKLMTQCRENLRTDGRTDRPYFIGPFRPKPGAQEC